MTYLYPLGQGMAYLYPLGQGMAYLLLTQSQDRLYRTSLLWTHLYRGVPSLAQRRRIP